MTTAVDPVKPRPVPSLDPDHPVASLLELAGISQGELGRRLGIPQSSVAAAVARGRGVTVEWLLRAAEAAELDVDVRAVKARRRRA